MRGFACAQRRSNWDMHRTIIVHALTRGILLGVAACGEAHSEARQGQIAWPAHH